MNERKKYIEMHESRIWQSTDGKWYTYLPDLDKKRKLIKRKSESEIKDAIVKYYKNSETDMTILDVFDSWIDKKLQRREIQKQTYDRYKRDFDRFYSFRKFGNRKIRYVDEDSLEDFVISSIVENNLTSKAYSNLRTITKGIFLHGKKKGNTNLNINNFFDDLDLSSKIFSKSSKKDSDNVYSEEELLKIIEELNKSQKIVHLGVLLAVYTGMRVGEIVALKWEDIHTDYIHINRRQVRYKDDNNVDVYEIKDSAKTEAGTRDVVIIPQVRKILKDAWRINPFTEYIFEKIGKIYI